MVGALSYIVVPSGRAALQSNHPGGKPIHKPENKIIPYTLTENNNGLSIDVLFRCMQPEEDATTDASSGWPAMEALLEFFMPLVDQDQTARLAIHVLT